MEGSTGAFVTGVLLLATTVQFSAVAALGMDLLPETAGRIELCSQDHIALAAGSSVTLSLTPSSSEQPQPCRLQVSADVASLLSIELVPLRTHPGEHREARVPRTGAAVSGSNSAKSGNMGLVYAGILQFHAAQRESSVNKSCTLATYVDGQVAWSIDLCDEEGSGTKNHIDNIPNKFSLVWTPPGKRSGLRVAAITITATRKGVPTESICSAKTVRLEPQGMASAIALELRAPEGSQEPCRVNIAAPSTHELSLLLVPTADSSSRSSEDSRGESAQLLDGVNNGANEDALEPSKPSCGLSLIVGCTFEYWKLDLCDPAAFALALNFTEVFPHNITLVWTPPPATRSGAQLASTVLLTALGKGEAMCSQKQFLPCWRQRRPRLQLLCVSKELVCDGYHNCPGDDNDEDPRVCMTNIEVAGEDRDGEASRSSSDTSNYFAKLLAETLLKHPQAHNQSYRHEETKYHDTNPDTLSNYGPWGYLMLGMLVCGAFLMLCGLWECCCRQPKSTPSTPTHTPTTVLMPQPGPGGVLALDSDLEDDPSRPPAYEDLDQPPAYGALFPGQPKNDVPVPTALLADATFPHADADDVPSVDSPTAAHSPS